MKTISKVYGLRGSSVRDFKKSWRPIVMAGVAGAWLALGGQAKAAECGDVTIAEMNWASAGLAANVDAIVLQAAFGCNVSFAAGDTLPTFASMSEKGKPEIAPELWVRVIGKPLDAAVKAGDLVIAGQVFSKGGVEAWWTPKYIVDEYPDIKTVQDALNHPELFPHPEDPSKGGIYNCPSGNSCQITGANNFKALGGAAKGFMLVDPGSLTTLGTTLTAAYEKKKGWLGFNWGPTAILGKYEMVMLPFTADAKHDPEEWARCTQVLDCPDPKVNAYPPGEAYTVVTGKFSKANPEVVAYLQKRALDNDVLAKVLAWMDDNQATNEDGAKYFLRTFPNAWQDWLPVQSLEKIQAEL